MISTFFTTFIKLFVAIDPFGMVPIFLAVTDGMTDERRRRVSFEAVAAALVICLLFMLLGESLFGFLGIRDYDFRIAGGILLLVLAIYHPLGPGKPAGGESLFGFLGIRDYDFRIAGGILLLVLAIYDLLVPGKPAVDERTTVGIVPLAMPLIAGPATLTTTLVLASRYGYWATALGLAVN